MTVGELREALRKWDSGLDVRTKVGEEFYEFDDMDDLQRLMNEQQVEVTW